MLTREQFMKLRAKGLTPEQIAGFEAGEKPGINRADIPLVLPNPLGGGMATTDLGTVAGQIPNIAGMLGGMGGKAVGAIGGPGVSYGAGVAGAGFAGGAGEAGRQVLLGEEMDPGKIAAQGAEQAAYEAAGGIFAKAGRGIGRGIMGRVLPRLSNVPFNQVVEGALESKVPVGKVIRTGSVVANKIRRAAGAETRDLLQQAKAARIRLTVAEIAHPAIQAEEEAMQRTLDPREKAAVIEAVRKRATEMLNTRRVANFLEVGPRLDPVQAKSLKQVAQKMSSGARTAQAMGQLVVGNPALDHSIAVGTRQAMEHRLAKGVLNRAGVPATMGIAEREAATREAINVQRAVQKAEARGGSVTIPLTGPFKLGQATPGVAMPREQASRLALMLYHASPWMSQLPRGIGAAWDQATQE